MRDQKKSHIIPGLARFGRLQLEAAPGCD